MVASRDAVADAAHLAVTNGGPAIEPGLAALLSEPFRRLCDPVDLPFRPGSACPSLRSLAVAHHGDVIARARPMLRAAWIASTFARLLETART